MSESTKVLGILGWPVAHSRSPAMHNAAIAALGLDAVYVPFAVRPDALAEAIRGVRALGIHGLNVTLPHKQEVMALLDEVDADARAIGAVNTIVRDGEKLIGYNTDAPGLVRSLEEGGVTFGGARVVVVGAGGAARAAVVGIARAGAARVAVASRRPEQAAELVGSVSGSLDCVVEAAPLETLAREFEGCELLVQATSATLEGSESATAFAASLPMDALPPSAIVTDLVYKPRKTTVLAAAEARGLATVDGLGMLLYQGAIAFSHWLGVEAPVEVMREAL